MSNGPIQWARGSCAKKRSVAARPTQMQTRKEDTVNLRCVSAVRDARTALKARLEVECWHRCLVGFLAAVGRLPFVSHSVGRHVLVHCNDLGALLPVLLLAIPSGLRREFESRGARTDVLWRRIHQGSPGGSRLDSGQQARRSVAVPGRLRWEVEQRPGKSIRHRRPEARPALISTVCSAHGCACQIQFFFFFLFIFSSL